MRKHYILWQWKEETSAEQVEVAMDKVLSLAGTVDGLIRVRNGRNLAQRLGAAYTHFTEMYFVDQGALVAGDRGWRDGMSFRFKAVEEEVRRQA